jgi:hypothetical protein
MVRHDGHQSAWQAGLEHLGRHPFFFLARSCLPGFLQTSAVQSVLLEKLPEGHFGDAEFPRPFEEVEQLVARGLGMREEKLGDGAGMAR